MEKFTRMVSFFSKKTMIGNTRSPFGMTFLVLEKVFLSGKKSTSST